MKEGKIYFEALEKPFTKGGKIALSQIIDPAGHTIVKFNRKEMRGFTKEEWMRILRVGICLNCHKENSALFKRWKRDLSCPKFPNL